MTKLWWSCRCYWGFKVRNTRMCWIRHSSQREVLQRVHSFLSVVIGILCKAINIVQCDRRGMGSVSQGPETWNGIWHQVTARLQFPKILPLSKGRNNVRESGQERLTERFSVIIKTHRGKWPLSQTLSLYDDNSHMCVLLNTFPWKQEWFPVPCTSPVDSGHGEWKHKFPWVPSEIQEFKICLRHALPNS